MLNILIKAITYELFDASTLPPASSFDPAEPFPDGQNRSLPSGILLPTGNLFVCGGISTTDSPCTEFDIQTNTWSAQANLGSIRQYHSATLLLPSGKVMMAGWNNPKIEIYSSPYLFNGPRPTITLAPTLVHHGANFTIDTPDAPEIGKVVLIRQNS